LHFPSTIYRILSTRKITRHLASTRNLYALKKYHRIAKNLYTRAKIASTIYRILNTRKNKLSSRNRYVRKKILTHYRILKQNITQNYISILKY